MRRRLPAALGVVAALTALVALAVGRPWIGGLAMLLGVLALQPVLLRSSGTVPVESGAAASRPRPAPRRLAAAVGVGLRGIGHLVLRVVGTVLGAIAFYLVLTPLGLGGRLLGLQFLPPGHWHRRPTSSPGGTARAFVSGRGGRGRGELASGGARLSWRVALVLIAVGALAATLVPRVLDRDTEESAAPQQLRGASFDAFASPALADAEWKNEAGAEFAAASAGQTYTSFVGNSLRDYEGRYVNVRDRQRRSYRPDAIDEAGTEPLEVWFFGSSMMFGFSAQRDLHTIPSEVARIAEADGVVVEARNFGAPGYVNMQETMLAAQLLASGQAPDLMVFYDGINDTSVLFQQAFGGIGVPGDPSDLTAFPYRRALAGELTGTDEPPATIAPAPDLGRPPSAQAVISALMDVYGRGVELATALGDQYGVPVVHFWAPDLFNKDHLVPGEDELLERLGMDRFQYDAVSRISRAIVAALPASTVDLSDAYDGTEQPVLSDTAHTNELGARLVAEAMYPHLPLVAGAGSG